MDSTLGEVFQGRCHCRKMGVGGVCRLWGHGWYGHWFLFQTCSGGSGGRGGRQCGPGSKWKCEDTRAESEGSTLERPALDTGFSAEGAQTPR